ncbi:MAG: helix-turn-helix transcriptional regulator [Candidatus Eremiobacteraeota bacterium]|nr:helix-turn-helix transcriptional regulator [Candidatus Eremiobacteraeota bacterium]
MNIPGYFGDQIRTARKAKRYTQTEVEKQLGFRPGRLSDLENNRRPPTPAELVKLASLLDVVAGHLRATLEEAERDSLAAARKRFAPSTRFYPKQDRPSFVRLLAARQRYPEHCRHLEWLIDDRPDLRQVQVYLRDQAFDSRLEMLAHLQLLANGAWPCWESPAAWGFEAETIIDPVSGARVGWRRRPALYLPGAQEAIVFGQVGVLLSRRACLDLLVGTRSGWMCVEFDGKGHDPWADAIRDELSIPLVRLEEDRVLDAAPGEWLRAG